MTAVKAAGLVDALSGDGPLTEFAPTDAAFAKLDAATLRSLLEPASEAKLTEILTFHVVPGRIGARDAIAAGSAETLRGGTAQGEPLRFTIRDGRLLVNGATVVSTDVDATNGVLHGIESVLLPNRAPRGRRAEAAPERSPGPPRAPPRRPAADPPPRPVPRGGTDRGPRRPTGSPAPAPRVPSRTDRKA